MTDPVPPDAEILDGFVAGEDRAAAVVREWVLGVVRYGRWRFEDPEGVAQEILLKLLRIVRAEGFARRSSFKTFVYSVARHTCIDVYRRQRLRTDVHAAEDPEAPSPSAGADERLEQRERFECLQYIFQKLPEECRQLWTWIYGDGLSAAEVGRRLGIKPGNVRVRTHRCLEKARAIGRGFLTGPALEPEAGA